MNQESLINFQNLRLLLSIENVGQIKILNLISKFGTIDEIFNAGIFKLQNAEYISQEVANKIHYTISNKDEFLSDLEPELDYLQQNNIKVLTILCDEYPIALKNIYSPPIILYYKGKHPNEFDNSIAVVGTRTPTQYGKNHAKFFSEELANNGIPIVSGMARGIDSIAHKSALSVQGKTIAVIGSGLDVIYPPENRALFEEICEKGCVLSEYKCGTKPDAQNFPKRNRIISGLSKGTLIIETKKKGGALQTASLALDQNRDVFALPGNVGSPQSEGTNILIQKGEAKLVLSPQNIISELGLNNNRDRNDVKLAIALSLFEEKIYDLLSDIPIHIDNIALEANMPTADCLVNLLNMEFKGVAKQLYGKTFIKA
ncbi:MAG: DNA-protecting protein DprA [Melioribacteraceae bacterium]|nr:DNA-protecting protein DprA [Melioribacteraceae bacterium]